MSFNKAEDKPSSTSSAVVAWTTPKTPVTTKATSNFQGKLIVVLIKKKML